MREPKCKPALWWNLALTFHFTEKLNGRGIERRTEATLSFSFHFFYSSSHTGSDHGVVLITPFLIHFHAPTHQKPTKRKPSMKQPIPNTMPIFHCLHLNVLYQKPTQMWQNTHQKKSMDFLHTHHELWLPSHFCLSLAHIKPAPPQKNDDFLIGKLGLKVDVHFCQKKNRRNERGRGDQEISYLGLTTQIGNDGAN